MRASSTLFALLPFALFAQSTTQVQVGGSLAGGTPPFYSPQNITINVGDIVQWTNTSGSHNVNGTTQLFPGNPQSFSSGAVAGGGWTYSFTFDVAGVYNYHCTAGGHSATQFGQITVVGSTTSVDENEQDASISLFPVPTSDNLTVELGTLSIRTAEVFSLDGQRVASEAVNGNSRVDVHVGGLASGNYFLRLITADGRTITRPFRKE
jgi:plastocyanin